MTAPAVAPVSPQEHNLDYMRKTRRKYGAARVINSAATTQNYGAGAPLVFEVPSTENGYLEYLEIDCNLTATYTAAGAGPTVAFNAGGAEQVIQSITVEIGRQQIKMYPFYLKRVQKMLRRYLGAEYASVAGGGYVNPDLDAIIQTDTPTLNAGANTWHLVIPIPLNVIHQLEPAGMLPIFGTSTSVKVTVQCAQQVVGNDPLNNAVSSNGTVVVSGTIGVNFAYRDGTRLDTTLRDTMMPQLLTGLPTVQWDIDVPTTEVYAGRYFPARITKLERFLMLVDLVIDGQQSNKFSTPGNIAGLAMTTDANGANPLWQIGANTNNGAAMAMYWRDLRNTFGQDLDDGVIPWVVSSSFNEQDISNQSGSQVLDTANAYPGFHLQYFLNNINGLGGNIARVEHLLVFLNDAGLQIV